MMTFAERKASCPRLVRGQDGKALDDGVEIGDRGRAAAQVRLDALEANHGTGRGFGHDLIIGAQGDEGAVLDNRAGALGLEGLAKGVDDEARDGIDLEQARDLLRYALVGGVVQDIVWVETDAAEAGGYAGVEERRSDGQLRNSHKVAQMAEDMTGVDRKSTRLNSSHL